jgi:hypothetical protein
MAYIGLGLNFEVVFVVGFFVEKVKFGCPY